MEQTHEDELTLEKFLVNKTPELREELIVKHLPLVRFVLGRLGLSRYQSVDYEDLEGQGLLGLIEAVDNFNPSFGAKLSTYATLRIRGKILDYLRGQDWMPRTARDRVKNVQKAVRDLELSLNRCPSDQEIITHLGIDSESYQQTLMDSSRILVSLDMDTNEGGDNDSAPLYEVLKDEEHDSPSDEIESKDTQRFIIQKLKEMPEKEQMVISLYYYDELTFKEIGEVLSISESRVCQLHGRAVLYLRSHVSSFSH